MKSYYCRSDYDSYESLHNWGKAVTKVVTHRDIKNKSLYELINRKTMRSQRNILRRISSFGTSKAPPTTPVPGKKSRWNWTVLALKWTVDDLSFGTFISEFPEFQSFHDLHRYSIDHHEEFWARISRSMISWEKDFTITARDPHTGWSTNQSVIFLNRVCGALMKRIMIFQKEELNGLPMVNSMLQARFHFSWLLIGLATSQWKPFKVNCVDRHLGTKSDQTAFIWEGDDPDHVEKVTYAEFHNLVCRLSNVLLSGGFSNWCWALIGRHKGHFWLAQFETQVS